MIDLWERQAMMANREIPDMTLNVLAQEPIEAMEATDPMLPMDKIDPTLPMESMEPVEYKDNTESLDPKLHLPLVLRSLLRFVRISRA